MDDGISCRPFLCSVGGLEKVSVLPNYSVCLDLSYDFDYGRILFVWFLEFALPSHLSGKFSVFPVRDALLF